MGVVTELDRKRDEAKEFLDKAHNCVVKMIDPDTQHGNFYGEGYIDSLYDIALNIKKLRRRL